jgi:hypothetical protein
MKVLLSMTLRTILGGVIRRRVCVHGFTAPREPTGHGCGGLAVAWNSGQDDVIDSIGGPLDVLWNGEASSRSSIQVLIEVGLLLRRIHVVRRQSSGRPGLLRNVGRWNRYNVVDIQVHVGGRLLLLLRLIVAMLLEGRGDCRKDGLNFRLEGLS